MKRTLALAAVPLLLAGCGSPAVEAQTAASQVTVVMTSNTLKESCQQLPTFGAYSATDALTELVDLRIIADAGDTTTRQTFQPMLTALSDLARASTPEAFLPAHSAYLDAILTLDDACSAAGAPFLG